MTDLGPITTPDLRSFFAREPAAAFVIEGLVHSADAAYLGQVAIHDRDAAFRMGWWGTLSPTSQFRLLPFTADEVGFDGVAVLFRQFESSKYKDHPVDYLAGWVPVEMLARAQAWVDDMNARIAARLGR